MKDSQSVLDHSNQAADADGIALDQWLKEQNITVPVGSIETDAKEATLAWGVKSLPWLILTDCQHMVRAEGFTILKDSGN